MPVAILYPHFDHPAIEERYASWQSQMLLRRAACDSHFYYYEPRESAADVFRGIEEPDVLVVTDPLVVAPAMLVQRLGSALETSGAAAALPVTNEARHPRQQRAFTPYVTLREFEEVASSIEPTELERVVWDDADPTLFLCRRVTFLDERAELGRALRGREVVIDPSSFVHVWSPMRAQVRDDLLPHIPLHARSLLELGCGEGALGALVKQRQKCRVVGIELDPHAASIARRKIDDVYTGDVRHIIEVIHEQFDCIVASEIIEHVDDSWSLLDELRRVTAPGGRLVVSIPNIANASIIGDLLRGRFDYTYIGLACAGHLRFFTRASIEDLLDIAGWRLETITPQRALVSPPAEELVSMLVANGLAIDGNELLATGYYVVARNE